MSTIPFRLKVPISDKEGFGEYAFELKNERMLSPFLTLLFQSYYSLPALRASIDGFIASNNDKISDLENQVKGKNLHAEISIQLRYTNDESVDNELNGLRNQGILKDRALILLYTYFLSEGVREGINTFIESRWYLKKKLKQPQKKVATTSTTNNIIQDSQLLEENKSLKLEIASLTSKLEVKDKEIEFYKEMYRELLAKVTVNTGREEVTVQSMPTLNSTPVNQEPVAQTYEQPIVQQTVQPMPVYSQPVQETPMQTVVQPQEQQVQVTPMQTQPQQVQPSPVVNQPVQTTPVQQSSPQGSSAGLDALSLFKKSQKSIEGLS